MSYLVELNILLIFNSTFKNRNMLNWSKYNYFIQDNDNYLIYNFFSNNLIKINKGKKKDIELSFHKNEQPNCLDTDIEILTKQSFLNSSDIKRYNNLRLGKFLNNFNSSYANISIAPTQDCNFDCIYCFEEHRKPIYIKENIKNKIIDFIKNLSKNKKINIEWYGGEPLLSFDIIKDISYRLIQENIKFHASIITNGYLLTSEKVSLFKELNISSIQITLDGLSSTHNKRRPLKNKEGTFDQIILNLENLFEIDNKLDFGQK